jgi:hypothetical protein
MFQRGRVTARCAMLLRRILGPDISSAALHKPTTLNFCGGPFSCLRVSGVRALLVQRGRVTARCAMLLRRILGPDISSGSTSPQHSIFVGGRFRVCVFRVFELCWFSGAVSQHAVQCCCAESWDQTFPQAPQAHNTQFFRKIDKPQYWGKPQWPL